MVTPGFWCNILQKSVVYLLNGSIICEAFLADKLVTSELHHLKFGKASLQCWASLCWLHAGVLDTLSLRCVWRCGTVTCGRHIDLIRGITACSRACGESLQQMRVAALVNSHVGTGGLSASTGMTAQVSLGTCSVRLDLQVHLESLLLQLLPDLPWDSCWHFMFSVSAQCVISRSLWLSYRIQNAH